MRFTTQAFPYLQIVVAMLPEGAVPWQIGQCGGGVGPAVFVPELCVGVPQLSAIMRRLKAYRRSDHW
jgi:hypothetical protein